MKESEWEVLCTDPTALLYLCGPGQRSLYSDSLWVGRSGDGMPAGKKFSAPVQTGPDNHPISYIMDTGSLSQGVKRPGRCVDHPPPSSAEV
jgi:hypothetical protein